jgi:hypothetical protein
MALNKLLLKYLGLPWARLRLGGSRLERVAEPCFTAV